MKRKNALYRIAALSALFFVMSCERACARYPETRITGQTMGTVYSVSIAHNNSSLSTKELKEKIDKRLAEINDIFSTYRTHSTISRFNRALTEDFSVEPELALVVKRAIEISLLTKGAFNMSIDHLIDLWGFDKSGRINKKPDESAIAIALMHTDPTKIIVRENSLKKAHQQASINLSGIAKGFAVDDIDRLLSSIGLMDYLVEIGGEMVARGKNINGKPWRIGIEDPNHPGDQSLLVARVGLSDLAIATSGTYLNHFVEQGIRYSHIIDPRTGRPVRNNRLSASVLAGDCMTADALATAALLMSDKDIEELAHKHPDLGFLLVGDSNELEKKFFGAFLAYVE